VVFDHERSHAAQGDNWKLLSLHCLPRLNLRLPSGKTWMQLWQNTAEWAADEDAVQGNRGRALLLAETLVRLARLTSAAVPAVACTYFVCQESELALRVERLIENQPRVPAVSGYRFGIALGCVLAAVLGVLVNLAVLLHDVPERLLHLG
jgi:beta-lactamase regulating signal transducer with metallopeptidase domain